MRLAVISFTQHGSRLNQMVSQALSLQDMTVTVMP